MTGEDVAMKKALTALTIVFFIFSACSLRAEVFVDTKVFINNKLEVYGLAGVPWESDISLDEERARAWMDALHHAYEDVLGLPLMEGRLVRHVLQTNAALKERLGPVLLTAPKAFFQPDASGIIRCRIEVPLSGKTSLRSALYLAAMRPQSQQPVSFAPNWATGAKVDGESVPPPFRRLILDVRTFAFEPSLFPRFFDGAGMLLFQEAMIPSPQRFSRPAVTFMDDITLARRELAEEDVYTIAAKVNVLALRDVTVDSADVDLFNRFCRAMTQYPLQDRELVIVYDPLRLQRSGRMGRAAKKEEAAEKLK